MNEKASKTVMLAAEGVIGALVLNMAILFSRLRGRR